MCAVKAPPPARQGEAAGWEGRCPTDFGYAVQFIQSNLVGLGAVAMDVRIHTSLICFNPERVKSVWIVDVPNPLPVFLGEVIVYLVVYGPVAGLQVGCYERYGPLARWVC
jgi:hypothetical protein